MTGVLHLRSRCFCALPPYCPVHFHPPEPVSLRNGVLFLRGGAEDGHRTTGVGPGTYHGDSHVEHTEGVHTLVVPCQSGIHWASPGNPGLLLATDGGSMRWPQPQEGFFSICVVTIHVYNGRSRIGHSVRTSPVQIAPYMKGHDVTLYVILVGFPWFQQVGLST